MLTVGSPSDAVQSGLRYMKEPRRCFAPLTATLSCVAAGWRAGTSVAWLAPDATAWLPVATGAAGVVVALVALFDGPAQAPSSNKRTMGVTPRISLPRICLNVRC